MANSLKDWLKSFPVVVEAKRQVSGTSGYTHHNILRAFPAYIPNSAGKYKDRAFLTAQAINDVFPSLVSLAETVQGRKLDVVNIEDLSSDEAVAESAARLKVLFDQYGSDKSNHHNFHHLYGAVLVNPGEVERIFEIGLGTNNTDVVSNMGEAGKPGASLRAFRDYCPDAVVYGADIDRRVLFQEDRIETFYVDQTDPKSFDDLHAAVPDGFDLIIDDGLHSPHANVISLEFGLKKVKKGGWVVIEDIYVEAVSIWQVVASILPADKYESHLFDADGTIVFAVKRLA